MSLLRKRFAGASVLPAAVIILMAPGSARGEGYPWGAESARVTGRHIAVQHVLAGAGPRVEESSEPASAAPSAEASLGEAGQVLTSFLESQQVPNELRARADELNKIYGGNILVAVDRSLNDAGAFTPRRYAPMPGGGKTLGPAVIRVNPEYFAKLKTDLSGVLTHEMQHARDAALRPRVSNDTRPVTLDGVTFEYREGPARIADLENASLIRYKTMYKPIHLSDPSARLGYREPLYEVSQRWHLMHIPDVETLNLPRGYFQDTLRYQQPMYQQPMPNRIESNLPIRHNLPQGTGVGGSW